MVVSLNTTTALAYLALAHINTMYANPGITEEDLAKAASSQPVMRKSGVYYSTTKVFAPVVRGNFTHRKMITIFYVVSDKGIIFGFDHLHNVAQFVGDETLYQQVVDETVIFELLTW